MIKSQIETTSTVQKLRFETGNDGIEFSFQFPGPKFDPVLISKSYKNKEAKKL